MCNRSLNIELMNEDDYKIDFQYENDLCEL